jgi:hypothetical protein
LTKPIQSWIHCFNSSFDCGVGTTVYLVDIIACSAFGFGWEDSRKQTMIDLFGPRILSFDFLRTGNPQKVNR